MSNISVAVGYLGVNGPRPFTPASATTAVIIGVVALAFGLVPGKAFYYLRNESLQRRLARLLFAIAGLWFIYEGAAYFIWD